MVRAWIFNEGDPSDQREPHFTNPIQWISIPHLQSLGVSYWHLPTVPQDAIDHPTSGPLGAIRTSRHYKNHDVIKVSPATLPNYEEKIQMFYREHLHEDEEIRYVLDGTGYFDVRRDKDDKWIRIEMSGGDMIVLPAGMYHRYTNDVKDFVHVMRLFKDNPKWEAINRGPQADATPSRSAYQQCLSPQSSSTGGEGVTVSSLIGPNGESFLLQHKAGALANYPHMRAYGGMLYVSGISSRRPDNSHEGVEVSADGTVAKDIRVQTRAVLRNIEAVLGVVGADMGHVVDATTYLVDMKDYGGYNEAWNEVFPVGLHGPSRTTVAVHQLPHPNLLIEIKVVAVDPRVAK